MKSGMTLKEFKKITKSYGNSVFTLLFCGHRIIECFFELSDMYFNLFYVNRRLLPFLNKISENVPTQLAYSIYILYVCSCGVWEYI